MNILDRDVAFQIPCPRKCVQVVTAHRDPFFIDYGRLRVKDAGAIRVHGDPFPNEVANDWPRGQACKPNIAADGDEDAYTNASVLRTQQSPQEQGARCEVGRGDIDRFLRPTDRP